MPKIARWAESGTLRPDVGTDKSIVYTVPPAQSQHSRCALPFQTPRSCLQEAWFHRHFNRVPISQASVLTFSVHASARCVFEPLKAAELCWRLHLGHVVPPLLLDTTTNFLLNLRLSVSFTVRGLGGR